MAVAKKTTFLFWILSVPFIVTIASFLINFASGITIDKLISQAAEARADNETETSFELLDRASALETFAWQKKHEVAFAIGESFESAGDFAQAAEKYALTAELLKDQSRFARIIKNAEDDRNDFSFRDRALQRAAFAYFNSAQYSKAIESMEARQDRTENQNQSARPLDDNDLVLIGRSQLRLGQTQKASSCFQDALEKNPTNEEASFYLALAMLEDDLAGAGALLQKHSYSAKFLDYVNAIKDASQKITESSSAIYKDIILADLFLRINEPELAQNYAERALSADPNYRDGWIVKAEALFERLLFDEAEEAALEATEKDPTFKPAFSLLAKIKTAQGDLAAAKDYQQKAELLR